MSDSISIGVSTSAWAELPLTRTLERVAAITAAVEVRSFGMHSLLDPVNCRAVRESGLACSVHGPFGHQDDGIGSVSEPGRQEALDLHSQHLLAAAEVGAALYVIHPDLRPVPRPLEAPVVSALHRSLESLREMQAEFGVPIVLENMPIFGCSHFTHPGDLDLHGLGLALDVGHANISGCLEAWLDDPRAPLRHLHLHDNQGPSDIEDPHGALGSGTIDVSAVLTAARSADATAVLEHYSEDAVRASLTYLRGIALLD